MSRWPYFNYESDTMLACPCCGKKGMDDDFMKKVAQIRGECGFPFTVTSGYRCPEHNDKVSGSGKTGAHTTGRALDIAADGRKKFKIMEAAVGHGFARFGIGKTFIHIDDVAGFERFSQNVVWTY